MSSRSFNSQVFISENCGPLVREKLRDVVLRYRPSRRDPERYDVHLFINRKHVQFFGFMSIPEIDGFEAVIATMLELGYRQAVHDFILEPMPGPWEGVYRPEDLDLPSPVNEKQAS